MLRGLYVAVVCGGFCEVISHIEPIRKYSHVNPRTEGPTCGLNKTLTTMTSISNGATPGERVLTREQLELHDVLPFVRPTDMSDMDDVNNAFDNMLMLFSMRQSERTIVFVDGAPVGHHHDGLQLVDMLRDDRRNNIIHRETSICLSQCKRFIHLYNDPGRLLRPLLIIDRATNMPRLKPNNICRYTIPEMLDQHFIELLDVSEYDNWMNSTAVTMRDIIGETNGGPRVGNCRFTHAEIHPMLMLGPSEAMSPFPDHNQSPRNSYNTAMFKSAIGCVPNIRARMDNSAFTLDSPQCALVRSEPFYSLFNLDEMPTGMNAVVAFTTWSGYSVNDSIIMNQSAIERGALKVTKYVTVRVDERSIINSGNQTMRNRGQHVVRIVHVPVHIDTVTGLPRLGTVLDTNDVLMVPLHDGIRLMHGTDTFASGEANDDTFVTPDEQRAPTPVDRHQPGFVYIKKENVGIVDKIERSNAVDANGAHVLTKIRMRTNRPVIIGDKLCSMHGQKGTVGMTYTQQDMPFMSDGTSVDIIVNPHGIVEHGSWSGSIHLLCYVAACFFSIHLFYTWNIESTLNT